MKGIFVTATDTGAGKTIVTGLLARFLKDKGFNVVTQKWIQTGYADFSSSDIGLHCKIMGSKKIASQDLVLPYVFRTPSSPHLAAQIEKRRINQEKIIRNFNILKKKFDFVIVEGIGGALVPFDRKNLVIDIAKQLNLAVLVVAQNKLGGINHTLLTLEALRSRKLKTLGLIFNNSKDVPHRILQDNPKIIRALAKEKIFGILPWRKNLKKLSKEFTSIGNKIMKELFI